MAKINNPTDESQTDFYQILGVNEDASYSEIKKKWLKLSLIYHPDKCGGNNDMFRKINLAYKVLSNPQNRKKYNDSLAKTHDQLKEVDRDLMYHVNPEFVVQNTQGGVEFNRDRFLNEFERSRKLYQDLTTIDPISEQAAIAQPKPNVQHLENLVADRDRELENFKQTQKSELFNPKEQNDEFNFIFDQYQKLIKATELEPVCNDDPDDEYASISVLNNAPVHSSQLLDQMTQQFQQHFGQGKQPTPVVTREEKLDLENIKAKVSAYRQEGEQIQQVIQEKGGYQIDYNDQDKVTLDQIDQ